MVPVRQAHYPSLAGRVVLVTGGGSGIGAAIVRRFAGQGSRVAFLDIDEASSTQLVSDLPGENAALYVPCDLRESAALRAALRRVAAELGAIEVLVNNAANDDRHAIDAVDDAYFDDRIAVNLKHYFFAIQGVCTGMAQCGGGSIINVGSVSWRLGMPGLPLYATAKAGIVGLTKTLAGELGPQRIRVNCIEPGFVATERQRRLWFTPELEAQVRAGQSLPDLIEPDAIASMALFLAADDSRMCTGQTFVVDGGWT